MRRGLPWYPPAPILEEMLKTISMSELTKHAERIAKDIETTGTIYRIKRPGKTKLMLISAQDLQRWQETVEFLAQHPNLQQELAEGDREYRAGEFVPFEDVLRELGVETHASKARSSKTARRVASGRRTKSR
jgi:PHD/YefM family antitoxin component YafN of YafNO toxin-antitoxin module